MKKCLIIVLTIYLSLSMVACNANNGVLEGTETGDINQTFYTNAQKIEICVGESKFYFENSEDVTAICELFEGIVGSEVPSDTIPAEGFYEITFHTTGKAVPVILTGSTIFIDGVEYFTNKDIIKPLSNFLK